MSCRGRPAAAGRDSCSPSVAPTGAAMLMGACSLGLASAQHTAGKRSPTSSSHRSAQAMVVPPCCILYGSSYGSTPCDRWCWEQGRCAAGGGGFAALGARRLHEPSPWRRDVQSTAAGCDAAGRAGQGLQSTLPPSYSRTPEQQRWTQAQAHQKPTSMQCMWPPHAHPYSRSPDSGSSGSSDSSSSGSSGSGRQLTRMRVLQSSPVQPAGQRHQPLMLSHTPMKLQPLQQTRGAAGRPSLRAACAGSSRRRRAHAARQQRLQREQRAPSTQLGVLAVSFGCSPKAGAVAAGRRQRRDGRLCVIAAAPVAARGAAALRHYGRVGLRDGAAHDAPKLLPGVAAAAAAFAVTFTAAAAAAAAAAATLPPQRVEQGLLPLRALQIARRNPSFSAAEGLD